MLTSSGKSSRSKNKAHWPLIISVVMATLLIERYFPGWSSPIVTTALVFGLVVTFCRDRLHEVPYWLVLISFTGAFAFINVWLRPWMNLWGYAFIFVVALVESTALVVVVARLPRATTTDQTPRS